MTTPRGIFHQAVLASICLAGLAQLGCHSTSASTSKPTVATPNDSAVPTHTPTKPTPMAISNAFESNELLLQNVRERLIAMLPATGTFAVLLQLGQGPVAARAKTDLLASLQAEQRIVWSQVTSQPGPPVADNARPGQHVNTVATSIQPPPQLVLLVNVVDQRLFIAARPPGADPLGPPTADWTWVLSGP